MNAAQEKAVHSLWDELADFDMAKTDDALLHLLRSLCHLLGAQQGYWLGAVRTDRKDGEDILNGWRPAAIRYLDTRPAEQQIYRKGLREIEKGQPGESTLNHVRQAGHFRSVLLREHVSPEFFASAHFENFYASRNFHDALFVVTPVNRDAEAYFVFLRDTHNPLFTAESRDLAALALRSCKWFHRQIMLSYGLLIASKPLTAAERRVLGQLLTAKPEKRITADMALNPATVHAHILSIYRKFGTSSRAGLSALWRGSM